MPRCESCIGFQGVKACSWSTANGRILGNGSSDVAVPTTCRRRTSDIKRSHANWKSVSTFERSGPRGFDLSAFASGSVTLKSMSSRSLDTSSSDSCGIATVTPSRVLTRSSTDVYPTRVRVSVGASSLLRQMPGTATVSCGARLPRPSAAPMYNAMCSSRTATLRARSAW